eukprot:CAMPEP_0203933192 /NCGR_PEP_ID=MMETSP0359-20131031/71439_1 /ASSEMBLY_ACC=CAM_ASM_000338 /TAXON_ID=268821 /ORGANISM="Scrippsiella Hangoei, Strain SHTV-5" /LENGTH=157 /DNA_ID=CAMNT_0050862743 /DNA_START=146 /DNA_END=617 /DNA_ORIENTATION=+
MNTAAVARAAPAIRAGNRRFSEVAATIEQMTASPITAWGHWSALVVDTSRGLVRRQDGAQAVAVAAASAAAEAAAAAAADEVGGRPNGRRPNEALLPCASGADVVVAFPATEQRAPNVNALAADVAIVDNLVGVGDRALEGVALRADVLQGGPSVDH